MNQSKRWATMLAALACLILVSSAWAQTSPSYDLSWHVLAGGGQNMASTNRLVYSTLGQFAIGPAYSTNNTLAAGYWYGIHRLAPVPTYSIYLPIVIKNLIP